LNSFNFGVPARESLPRQVSGRGGNQDIQYVWTPACAGVTGNRE